MYVEELVSKYVLVATIKYVGSGLYPMTAMSVSQHEWWKNKENSYSLQNCVRVTTINYWDQTSLNTEQNIQVDNDRGRSFLISGEDRIFVPHNNLEPKKQPLLAVTHVQKFEVSVRRPVRGLDDELM